MLPGVSTDLLMHRQIHSSKRKLLAQAKQKLDWWVQGRLPRWKEAGHLENNRNWVGIKERLWGHEAPGKAGGGGGVVVGVWDAWEASASQASPLLLTGCLCSRGRLSSIIPFQNLQGTIVNEVIECPLLL